MATSQIVQRTLSAFRPPQRAWTPISPALAATQVKELPIPPTRVSLVTQNVDAFSPRPIARAQLLLSDILEATHPPDILFLQEVTSDVHSAILANPKVREAFLVTDAEDRTSFEDVPFANITLLARKRFAFDFDSSKVGEKEPEEAFGDRYILGPVSRITLSSEYRRCALAVDIIPSFASSVTFRLINVHLDSLGHTFQYRAAQLEILANLLREPGCSGGLIAGDFNAISPADHMLLDKNGLVDAWVALHGEAGVEGATWGVDVARRDGLRAGRLDKVAMVALQAQKMQILRPRQIEVPKPCAPSKYIPYSDHFGLKLDFTI
ncbi:Endonuclease/exonuclease/phosphatase [Schizophyllum commune]